MPLNINLQQILLHLFNFVVLFAILYFLLYKPVKDFMDKRTAAYEDMDRRAKEALAQAEQSREEYAARLAQADQEIAAKRVQAQQQLDAQTDAQRRQARDEAEKLLENARRTVESERARMLREARAEIADIAVDAAQKIVSGSNTSQAYEDFLSFGGGEQHGQ